MKKKRFTVAEGETLAACLERMKREGYRPIRRVEQPIFREVEANGETTVEPCGRIIEFEAVRDEP
ncbi:NETI motif-containing protein [Geobacillus sp. BMUD]|uniref:NETI motif-containing protein n=1 Tax=Geobacillus TaxID=129337 RepID=UPI0004DF29A0|nr:MULTISPECIES: NETI motif-containing protein [Geobacillus]NNU82970.1 NETI motif-containing protein [Geobacillus sp. BMUD]